MSGLKRFIFWDYPRATWQYDVMVVLILAFIFLTPRELFRDQPRASNIVRLPSETGPAISWVEPELLQNVSESERSARVERELRSRFGSGSRIVQLQPILNAEHEVLGYMAYTARL